MCSRLGGMAGGVGFAIVENMLYEAARARVWAGVALPRSIGGVLHPLTAGLVALGWYGVRHGQLDARQLLFVVTKRLRDLDQPAVESALSLRLEQPRRLALWACGLMLVVVPLGALYGPLLAGYLHRLLPVGR